MMHLENTTELCVELRRQVHALSAAVETQRNRADSLAEAYRFEQGENDTLRSRLRAQAGTMEYQAALLAELQATLENEQGQGLGPSENWSYDKSVWKRPDGRVWRFGTVWRWLQVGVGEADEPTARDAMNAADAALRSHQESRSPS